MSMTNEEVALLIRQGRTELYAELWAQNERFFQMKTSQYWSNHKDTCTCAGIEKDDVLQACFLALYDAVQAFEPETGYKLLSYTKYPLKNRFTELYNSRDTNRVKPLNNTVGIDTPLSGTDGLTLGDTLPDESALEDFENAEHRMITEHLHAVLDEILAAMPEEQRETIRLRYTENLPLRCISEKLGGVDARALETQAMRKLQQPGNRLRLFRFYGELFDAYAGTGFGAFKRTQSSQPERFVERVERIEQRRQGDIDIHA